MTTHAHIRLEDALATYLSDLAVIAIAASLTRIGCSVITVRRANRIRSR